MGVAICVFCWTQDKVQTNNSDSRNDLISENLKVPENYNSEKYMKIL